jgi:hypothetical protein
MIGCVWECPLENEKAESEKPADRDQRNSIRQIQIITNERILRNTGRKGQKNHSYFDLPQTT